MTGSLQAAALRRAYLAGRSTPDAVVTEVHDRIAARGDDAVWIHLVDPAQARAAARALAARYAGRELPPLYGLPFAVKDNIDVAGLPTTAACAGFASVATRTAPAVQRLLDAGALLVGKTNLDQFATGLTGTRSPYGIVRNPFDPAVISGGSSSGSAVAVAAGLVTFALGTDTAGSGRVPAGLTGTVGVKPSRGLVSTRGVVPACRSLDCVSVFALSVADGAAVLAVAGGRDADDPWSRDLPVPPAAPRRDGLVGLRIGVPDPQSLDFAGDRGAREGFAAAIARLEALGVRTVPVDLDPFVAVGTLLYQGPWIAERMVDLEEFVRSEPGALHPVTAQVLAGAAAVTGVDVFRGEHALAEARVRTAPVWAGVDAIIVPTAPTAPTIEAVLGDPIRQNAALGRYTNFVNLLDLAAVAVPSTIAPGGVPRGVTFLAPAGSDTLLLGLAAAWQRDVGLPVGATGESLEFEPADVASTAPPVAAPDEVLLAVVGAHLEGEPLHPVLTGLGGRLHARTRTARRYRLFALPGEPGAPARPGLVRVSTRGEQIAAEVYRLPVVELGALVAGIPAPLGIGTVELDDGSSVLGFLCEEVATRTARDITAHGGWRAFLASERPDPAALDVTRTV
ncbi:MAG TPA: allophanate hydrolase [Actinotalea sp.]|nr:allophanate hydrolase [Actinotalea sp.]